MEANSCGLRQEVLDWAKSLMDADPRMDKVDAYQLAYHELIK
jgi:hypothetical protein